MPAMAARVKVVILLGRITQNVFSSRAIRPAPILTHLDGEPNRLGIRLYTPDRRIKVGIELVAVVVTDVHYLNRAPPRIPPGAHLPDYQLLAVHDVDHLEWVYVDIVSSIRVPLHSFE